MLQMRVIPKIPGTTLNDALKNADNVFRQLANQTKGQEYTLVPIAFADLKNGAKSESTQTLDKDLQCHCMTASDNITACALTNTTFTDVYAKRMLRQFLMEFREYYADPAVYTDLVADEEPDSLNFNFDKMHEIFVAWRDPLQADAQLKMEKDLFEIKDVMLDNLQKVIERGENITVLQDRATQLGVQTNNFKRKSKKLNQGFFARFAMCGGGGGMCQGSNS